MSEVVQFNLLKAFTNNYKRGIGIGKQYDHILYMPKFLCEPLLSLVIMVVHIVPILWLKESHHILMLSCKETTTPIQAYMFVWTLFEKQIQGLRQEMNEA